MSLLPPPPLTLLWLDSEPWFLMLTNKSIWSTDGGCMLLFNCTPSCCVSLTTHRPTQLWPRSAQWEPGPALMSPLLSQSPPDQSLRPETPTWWDKTKTVSRSTQVFSAERKQALCVSQCGSRHWGLPGPVEPLTLLSTTREQIDKTTD